LNIQAKVVGAIGIVIVVITLLALTGTVVEQVASQLIEAEATATEWNFTGAEGAKAILGLVPFIWVASILVCASVGMFTLAKSGA